MDELEFRRRAYSAPHSQEADFIKAATEDERKGAFLFELKRLDRQIEHALEVEIPQGLADKLLLRQQFAEVQRRRHRSIRLLASVASLAFAVAVGISLLRLGPVDLSQQALAHVYHEAAALNSNDNIALTEVNRSLADIPGLEQAQLAGLPGRIVYKAYCDFQGVRSLHLILEGDGGRVTLFIVPQERRMQLAEQFADNRFRGVGFKTEHALMLLLGDNAEQLSPLKQEIQQLII